MIKKLTHNWQWKLLSLVIAVIFWAMIVNIDDPSENAVYTDIPVIIENEDAITSQNLAIEYLEGTTVDVYLEGKRSVMDKLSSDDVKAYADLSRVSITNAISIRIEAGDQLDVLKTEPSELLIATEQIKSVLKSIQVRFRGELPDDYVKLQAIVTPNQIEITGPESKVALVSSVVVPIDLEQAIDDVTVFATPELLDSDSNEIRDLEVNNDQIQVKVPIQKIKTIPVNVTTVGELNENYRLMSMEIDTKAVIIRGEEEDIDNITKLEVNDIDLTSMTDATTAMSLMLENYLPENINIYEPSPATANLTIDIEPIIRASKIIELEDINVKQIPEGLQFHFLEEEAFSIGLKGIYKELSNLDVEDMLPRIILKDLEVGIHTLPLDLTIPDRFEVTSEMPEVQIELTEIPEEISEEDGEAQDGSDTSDSATE